MYQSQFLTILYPVAYLLWPLAVALYARHNMFVFCIWHIIIYYYMIIFFLNTVLVFAVPHEIYAASFYEKIGDRIQQPTEYTIDFLLFSVILLTPILLSFVVSQD